MNRKIIALILAFDNCEGIEIPYPIAKKMADVSKDLKAWAEHASPGIEFYWRTLNYTGE